MRSRRVAVVATEVLGLQGAGGPATADSLLALALARHGHSVELVVAPGRDLTRLGPQWRSRYADAGVEVRPLSETTAVIPSFLAPPWHVHEALRSRPPDVVVADDWRALSYAALRSRQLGRSCEDTAFVLYCHGPARVFAEAARKVPDALPRFGEEVAQRACLELADAAVSPSEWLLGWLQEHQWRVPDSARVIQNLWQSTALDEAPAVAASGSPIRRLAFFGQVRDGKGARLFIDSLRGLDPERLDDVEVLFLGHSRTWTEALLRREVGRPIRFEPALDRAAALEELSRPGTLAVMPSLLENSPYAVAECIEHAIPFIATRVGGTPELVAPEDRDAVLCDPTADGLAAALADALTTPPRPARPARAPQDSLAAWLDLIANVEPRERPGRSAETPTEWTLFGADDVRPDDGLLHALAAAQAVSGADVVTAGVREGRAVRLFLGDPGPLGLIENHYGVVGLARGSAVTAESPWALCARLAAAGGEIVSIPEALATRVSVREEPGDRLAVLQAFEHGDGRALAQLPQLAATLAAALARPRAIEAPRGVRQRLRRLLG
jgi:glycosyltransferase involved in cell wall biosynthesis